MPETASNITATVHDWFQDFEKTNLILCFKGDFNQDLVNSILIIAETKSEYHDNKTAVKSRIFSILVESMQNICKYGAGINAELKPGIVLVGREENYFFIQTGNLLRNEEVPNLQERLNRISKMSKEDLKVAHKKIIQETTLNEKSGAGLGLVSIARKAEKISSEIKKIDERNSFFAFEAIVAST